MKNSGESNPIAKEGLTELEHIFLNSFEIGETKLVNLNTRLANLNPNNELTIHSLITELIKKGYLQDVDKLHHPNSATWRLKRIR